MTTPATISLQALTRDVIELETAYLDLDGDGVPDAIEIIEAVAVDYTGDGIPNVVEIRKEFATDIGIDGVPAHVARVDGAVIPVNANNQAA